MVISVARVARSRDRALPEGAEPRPADRRRRPGGLDLLRRPGPPVSRRGDRQGHLPGELRPVGRRRVRARLRPGLVPDRAPARARGGHPRRGSGGTSVFAMLETAKRFGPEATIPTTIPDGGRGYLSKLFDDNWMLEHGFLERYGPADNSRAGAGLQALRRGHPGPRRLRIAPEARRGDRAHAALRDLAAPGRAQRAGRDSQRRRRVAERARPARPASSAPGRARGGGRGCDGTAAPGRRRRRPCRNRSSATCASRARRSSSRATDAPRPC